MTTEAAWRGCTVRVLSRDARQAVIVTPLGYRLRIRARELSPLPAKRVQAGQRRMTNP
jgi:hypothetical protein